MRTPATTHAAPVARGDVLPRLLAGLDSAEGGPTGVAEHLARWGALNLRHTRGGLIDELEASGLVGHGGAWFPVAAKWRAVATGRRRPVVVANGAEGEPASAKDALILARNPQLVLDGASAAAHALGAGRVVVYVPERLASDVAAAVEQRHRYDFDPVAIEVVSAPDTFIAGQETAVVSALNRRAALPSFAGLQPIRERGVGGRPTLVQNVETLAHVGLIARFGASWFRSVGTERFPGTMLLTVSGRWGRPVVLEAPLGIALGDLLQLSPGTTGEYHGALLGGYGGGWVSMHTLLDLELTEASARQHETSLGAGVVVLLARSVCPLAEMARVVRFMEQQGAGQCGPCVHGLAALAEEVESLVLRPKALRGRIDSILELCALVDGRGACRHPDGVARFVRTACTVFDDEVARHLRHGPCPETRSPGVLKVPHPRRVRRTNIEVGSR